MMNRTNRAPADGGLDIAVLLKLLTSLSGLSGTGTDTTPTTP